jgi:hypothetical protein
MECKFVVGQQVVCIKKDSWVYLGTTFVVEAPAPKYGEVVTITDIETLDVFVSTEWNNGIYLKLKEYPDGRYFHENFKPLETTDISVFQKLLAPGPKEKIVVEERELEKV